MNRRLAVFFSAMALAATAAPALAANLATGRPVRFSRPASYAACTDALDSLQLTDGARSSSRWLWLDPRTVGWKLETGDLVTLELDLGNRYRLDSLVVHTAFYPRSEVRPPSLVVAAGATRDSLRWMGALDAAPRAGANVVTEPRRVRLAVPLAGWGRRVLLAAMAHDRYLFADEVEVHGEALPPGSPIAYVGGDWPSPFAAGDIDKVCAAERRLWAVRAALPAELPGKTGPGAGPIAVEAARFAARARAWRGPGLPVLRVRRVDPWVDSNPWSELHPEVRDTLQLWPGAWEAAAIDAANAGPDTLRLALEVASGGTGAPRCTLREVMYVESRSGGWAGDALPKAGGALEIAPGAVRQVWLDLDAGEATAGRYEIRIAIGDRGVSIPVRVHALPPAARPLGALDWTYPLAFGLPRYDPRAAVEDNLAHGVDSWCLHSNAVPWPDPASIDASGRLRQALDFSACDRELDLLAGHVPRRLGWYLDFKPQEDDPSRGRFRHPWLSPAWKRAVREWLDAWLAHLEQRGFERSQLFLQPFDETTATSAVDFYVWLHTTRPDLRLALTMTRSAEDRALRRLHGAVGMAMVARDAIAQHSEWIARARRDGTEIWIYDAPEPAKMASPGGSYRALAWEAWARGFAGCAFWAWGDTGDGADAWNDFDGTRSDFAVVYGAPGAPRPLGEPFAPSKRWQAFRIGMQEAALCEWRAATAGDLRSRLLAAFRRGDWDPGTWRAQLLTGRD